MLTNPIRIRKFVTFLGELLTQHCGAGSCEYKVSTCPVRRELDEAYYGDFNWCAKCNGYLSRLGRAEDKEKGKAILAQEEIQYRPVYSGGFIVGVSSDGEHKILYACSCDAGQAFSDSVTGGVKEFDFSKSPDACFQQRVQDRIDWERRMAQKAREARLERQKARAKQFQAKEKP